MTLIPLSAVAGHNVTAWESFVAIIGKADNMPVAGMLGLVIFFTYFSIKQGRANDRLIKEGRKDEVLSKMQDG